MSELCDSCRKFFQDWEKLAHLKYKGILYSSINVKDLESNASIGCSLCKMMIGSIRQTVRDMWKANKPIIQWLRLSVDLSGIKRDGCQFYVLRLDYGIGVVEICIIPVLGLFKLQALSNP